MPNIFSSNRATDRCSVIANLIRNSYADLRGLLSSPYVDGLEIHRCLVTLGHDLSGDSLEIVSEALGWKCMRLPVANIEGKPKYYLPLAVRTEGLEAAGISSQTAACVRNLREFGKSA